MMNVCFGNVVNIIITDTNIISKIKIYDETIEMKRIQISNK